MPIIPFLRSETFGLEIVEAMSQAFSEVRLILGLSDATDQVAGIVARRIIELAQQGVRTKAALVMHVMEEFKATAH